MHFTGLDPAVADLIGEYVKLSGGMDLVEKLKTDERLVKNKDAKEAIEEMTLLLQVLKESLMILYLNVRYLIFTDIPKYTIHRFAAAEFLLIVTS